MSSRRKQSKPKAFGMSDDEVEVTAANGQASLISDKPETSDQTTTSCSISQGQENITIRSEETTSNNYSEVGIKVNGKETPIDEIANANERKRKRDEEETDVDQTFDEVSTNTNKIKSSHFETDNNTETNTTTATTTTSTTTATTYSATSIDWLRTNLNQDENTVHSIDGMSSNDCEIINSGESMGGGEDDLDEDLDDEEDEDDEDIALDQSDFSFSQYHPASQYSADALNPNAQQNMLLMFKCRVCGKAFKHRRSLNRHVKLHSGEKNFKCPFCSTAFARSDHLKAHIRTHNNSKPYRCSVCQCGYSTQAALKVHIAHHHTKSKFRCMLCNDLEFHSQLALEGHMYTKHSKENNVTNMDELINETATINPTLVSLEEAANMSNGGGESSSYSLHQHQQRSRLIDINNYNTSLTPSGQLTNGGTAGNNSMHNNFNTSTTTTTTNNINNNTHIKQTTDGKHASNGEYDAECEEISPANNNTKIYTTNINNNSNAAKRGIEGEEESENTDDVIIEEGLNSNTPRQYCNTQSLMPPQLLNENDPKFRSIAPKPPQQTYNPHQNMNRPSMPSGHLPPPQLKLGPVPHNLQPHLYNQPPPSSHHPTRPWPTPPSHHHMLPNTYCELCNARFVNVESYGAHMRNCHPNITPHHNPHHHHHHPPPHSHIPPHQIQQQQQPVAKMPYLTSILNSQVPNANKPTSSHPSNNNIHNHNHNPGMKPGLLPPQMVTQVVRASANSIHSTHNANSSLPPSQPPPPPPPQPPQMKDAVCHVPSCNCSMKPPNTNSNINASYPSHLPARTFLHHNQQMDEYMLDDYHIARDTYYTCVQCQLTLHKLSEYMLHLKQEHCVEVYRCVLCKQMQLFDNLNLLKEHFFQQHQSHKYDVFKCKLCLQQPSSAHTNNNGKGFVYVEDLCMHLKNAHNKIVDINRLRQYCGASVTGQNMAVSSSSSSFQASSQTTPPNYPHAPPPPPPPQMPMKCFKCQHCESDFAQQAALHQHMQMVHHSSPQQQQQQQQQHQQQQFACNLCRNTFTQRSQLERHMRIHNTSIDLKCNICDLKFTSHELLNEHKLIHTKSVTSAPIHPNPPNNNNAITTTNSIDSSSAAPQTTGSNCAYCKQTLHSEAQFKDHFKRHNNIGQPLPAGSARPNSYICIVCRQTLCSNQEYALHMRHHLRQPLKQPQTKTATTTTTTTTTTKTAIQPFSETIVCQKFLLRCNKCPVKFEYGQDYVNHLSKWHPEEKSTVQCLSSPSASPLSNKSAKQQVNVGNNSNSNNPATPSSAVKAERTSPLNATSSQPIIQQQNSSPLVKGLLQQPSPKAQPSHQYSNHTSSHQPNYPPALTPVVPYHQHQSNQQSPQTQSPNSYQPNQLLCEICSSKFDTPMRLQAHLLVKHEQHQQHLQPNMNGQVAFSCPVCDEGFIRPDQLIAHVHVHGPAAKIYKCSQCPAAFVFKSQLINHSFSHQQHHHHYQQINKASSFQANMNLIRSPADKPVQLSSHYLNRAVQNSQNSIMQQLQPHINSNLRMTVQSSNLNYSNNPSSNRTQYQNQINENRNNSIAHNDNSNNLMNYDPGDNLLPNQYIVNDNNIDGSKTYTCLTCSKTFNTPRNLSVHMRIHTGYRPFECNVCKRTFTRRENLRSHMKCHLNVRPFSCSICNRTFRRRSHVISHLEVHFKSKLHTCIECTRQFDSIEVFLAHLIQQHNVYDRELIQQIKSKNILDLSHFNIDYGKLSCNSNSIMNRLINSGGSFNGNSNGKTSALNNGEFYEEEINDEEYLDDDELYDDIDGDYVDAEDDLDSNGHDSNEYNQNNSGGDINDMIMEVNGNVKETINDIAANKNNQSIFFENEDNLDLVTPSLGISDNELEIDYTD